MIKILMVDDHIIVREGLKQILSEEMDFRVVDEAGDGQETMEKFRQNSYDIVLLDISLPGRDGLEVLKEIKQISPKTEVLILSMHPEEQYAIRALRAGAAGYLTKKSATTEIVSAIRAVSSGKKYVSASLAQRLAQEVEVNRDRPMHETLSDREFQVMCMLAAGQTVSEIAEELLLSMQSISTYRSRILQKMHMSKNAELTQYAIRNDLLA